MYVHYNPITPFLNLRIFFAYPFQKVYKMFTQVLRMDKRQKKHIWGDSAKEGGSKKQYMFI